jgi:hypothetical protein
VARARARAVSSGGGGVWRLEVERAVRPSAVVVAHVDQRRYTLVYVKQQPAGQPPSRVVDCLIDAPA